MTTKTTQRREPGPNPPAQRQVAGKPQKRRSVSLRFPRKNLDKRVFTKTCTLLTRDSTKLFRQKTCPKRSKMKKHHFRSGIKIFALGAFTGYPVLPGVSAPLSDGDREYREKQMIIAMVAHSSSEHQLQTQSDCGCCMHAWSFSFFRAHTNICLPVLEPPSWKKT